VGNKWIDSHGSHTHNGLLQVSDFKALTYDVENTAVIVARIPSGAWILDVLVNVTTLFNDSGTDTINIGTTSGGSQILTTANGSVVAAGLISAATVGTPLCPMARRTADTVIYAQYNGQNNNATTGKAEIAVVWTMGARQDNE
jgi:hypothetical protein